MVPNPLTKITNIFKIEDCPRHLRPEPFTSQEPDPPMPPAKVPTFPGKPASYQEGTLAPIVPKEPGFVQDARGQWWQYAHPSNNLTRDQFPYATTRYLASRKPEPTWKYLWRRGSLPAKYDAEGYDQHAAKNALYKRHRALLKAEKDFAKYEKQMVKNKHVEYTPVALRPRSAEEEDGGDGYRAPPKVSSDPSSDQSRDPREGSSTSPPRDQSVSSPNPLETAGSGEQNAGIREQTDKKARRNARLHDSGAVSSGIDGGGHREDGTRERVQRETKDDAPVIPGAW